MAQGHTPIGVHSVNSICPAPTVCIKTRMGAGYKRKKNFFAFGYVVV